MCYLIDMCLVCLENSSTLTLIKFQNTNETNTGDKLKCLLPELELSSNIPKYICATCRSDLNKSYEFKQKCLRNMTTYEKHAQQITTKRPEIEFVNVVENEEIAIKEEANDELKLLLHEVKEEKSESDDACNRNEDIEENAQTEKLFKCETCNKSFKFPQNLKQHQFIHTNKYTCKICKKSFARMEHLNNHQLIHTGEKPYPCEVCKKSFRQLNSLKRHSLRHTGEKPFTCKVCNKTFGRLYTLQLHELLHSNEKPFTCDVCHKSFRHSQGLRQHKFLHIGEK